MKRMLVLLLALSMVLIACGDSGDDGLPEGFRDAYMQGCAADGNEKFCECTLDELEKKMSTDELIALASSIEDPNAEPPEELIEVTLLCIGELDLGE